MNQGLHIIIARYKEDLSWLKDIKIHENHKVTVYNKFEGSNLLPNVGRESHTYIHHILKDYIDPADHYMFLQGNPLDHESPKGIIKKVVENYDDYKHLDYVSLTKELVKDLNGLPASLRQGFPIGYLYEQVFGEGSSPEIFEFAQGACFVVKGSLIKNLSIQQWKILYDYASRSVDTIEAWCLERMWKTLFLGKSEKTYKDVIYDKHPPGYLELLKNSKKIPMLSPWANSLGYNHLKY